MANILLEHLGNERFSATLTQTHTATLVGQYPFPLYSVVATNTSPYEWFEVSPLEFGSSFLRAYIPTWSYGRRFNGGISTNNAPEQTLGYYMGLFGSAFEVTFDDLVRLSIHELEWHDWRLPQKIMAIIKDALNNLLGSTRLLPSELPNFTYHMDYGTAWREKSLLSLIDAGIDCNLPLAPLLRPDRRVTMIVVLDASSQSDALLELRKFEAYARRKGLRFPRIETFGISNKLVYVFKDEEDRACPVLVYFPLKRNNAYSADFDPEDCISSGYCSTYNFSYSMMQALELSGLVRYTIRQHCDTIWNELLLQSSIKKGGLKPPYIGFDSKKTAA